jgi:hypothetical protein
VTTVIGGVLAVTVSLASIPAVAQPNANKQERAAKLTQDAITRQEKGDTTGAVELYKQAYCLVPEPLLVYNIGTAFQKAGRVADAIAHFRLYLKVAPAGESSADAKNAIEQLKSNASPSTKDTPAAKISCAKEPTLCPDGSAPVAGQCKASEPDPPECGDGQELKDGACVDVAIVTPPEGGTETKGPSKTLLYAGIGAGGVGVITLGVGIMFGIKAMNLSNELSEYNDMNIGWSDEMLAKEAEGEAAERNQIIFTTAGGVLVVVGATMVVLGLRKSKTGESSAASTQIVPYATGDQVGLAIGGRY